MNRSIEVHFSINHIPYCAQGQGSDLESILEDAEYSVDCPDPKSFTPISELPEKHLQRVTEEFREKYAGYEN